jgi:hypothetical protein
MMSLVGLFLFVWCGAASVAVGQVDFIQPFDSSSPRQGESYGWRPFNAGFEGPDLDPQQRDGSLLLEDEHTIFAIAYYRLSVDVLNASIVARYGWRAAALVNMSHNFLSPSDVTVGDGFAFSFGSIPGNDNNTYFNSLNNASRTFLERGDTSPGVFAISHRTYEFANPGIYVTTNGSQMTLDQRTGTVLSQNKTRACAVVIEARVNGTSVSSQGLEQTFNKTYNATLLPPLSAGGGSRDHAWYLSARSGSSTTQTTILQLFVSVLTDSCSALQAPCPANSIGMASLYGAICISFSGVSPPAEVTAQSVNVQVSGAATAVRRLDGLSVIEYASLDSAGHIYALSVRVIGSGARWSFRRLDVCQFELVTDTLIIPLEPGVPVFSKVATVQLTSSVVDFLTTTSLTNIPTSSTATVTGFTSTRTPRPSPPPTTVQKFTTAPSAFSTEPPSTQSSSEELSTQSSEVTLSFSETTLESRTSTSSSMMSSSVASTSAASTSGTLDADVEPTLVTETTAFIAEIASAAALLCLIVVAVVVACLCAASRRKSADQAPKRSDLELVSPSTNSEAPSISSSDYGLLPSHPVVYDVGRVQTGNDNNYDIGNLGQQR